MRADLWWYCIRNKRLRLDTASISTNLCRQKRREGTELREHNLWLFSMEVACSSFLRRWEYRRLYIFCSPFLFSCPGRYHLGILDTCDLLTRTCRDRNWSSWQIQLYPWPLLSRTVYIFLNQCHLLIDTILLDTTCIRLRSFPRRKTGMMRYLRYLCTCLRHILCNLSTLQLPRTCFSHIRCMLTALLLVGVVQECSSSTRSSQSLIGIARQNTHRTRLRERRERKTDQQHSQHNQFAHRLVGIVQEYSSSM